MTTNTRMEQERRASQAGFALVEVMISIVIMTVGTGRDAGCVGCRSGC